MSDPSEMLGDGDRELLRYLVPRAGYLIDRGRWDEVAQGFADHVDVDFTSLLGGAPACVTRDELLASYQSFLPGCDAVQHLIVTVDVTPLAGARARVSSYARATHRFGELLWVAGGLYTHEMIRRGDGWAIAGIVFERLYEEGTRDVVDRAAARVAAGGSAAAAPRIETR